MSRRNHNPPRYAAELNGTMPGDRLMFPVSTGKPYYWGRHLQALLTRLADRRTEHHAIPGLKEDSSPQHNIDSSIFLVAGYLQRHTLYIKGLAKIIRFKRELKTKLKADDKSWEKYVKQHVCFPKKPKKPEEVWQETALLALQKNVIETINEDGDWEQVYEDGMFELYSNNARNTGNEWVKHLEEKIACTGNHPLITNEYSDTSVFYKESAADSSVQELNVVRWEEITRCKDFEDKSLLVQEAFEKNIKGYRDIVEEAATAYLDSFIEDNRDRCQFPKQEDEIYAAFYEEAKARSIQYILEESAVFWIFIESGKIDGLAYPFSENQTNTLLYQCIVQLCEVMKMTEEEASGSRAPAIRDVRPVTLVYGKYQLLEGRQESQKIVSREEEVLSGTLMQPRNNAGALNVKTLENLNLQLLSPEFQEMLRSQPRLFPTFMTVLDRFSTLLATAALQSNPEGSPSLRSSVTNIFSLLSPRAEESSDAAVQGQEFNFRS